ncbi:MAG: phospholipid-binding lipoprotein MlaA [Myxococcota bacterium]|jgi:phospholipid-binding lipoprotein MlaA
MKSKFAKYLCLLSILLILNTSPASSQDVDLQFNFDDEYQGEASAGKEDGLIYDPFEKVNRKIFSFNEVLDKKIAVPIIKKYIQYIPSQIRESIHNFTNNISTPFSVINSLLQGEGENAMASFSSFLINTTVGIGGIFDMAKNKKIQYNQEDFGQTFGKYGVGSGPYLVIPFLGPSNVRDLSGFATKQLINPLSFNALKLGGSKDLVNDNFFTYLSVSKIIDTRVRLIDIVDDVRKNSFDVYATMRSAFLQRRKALILNQ